MKHGYVVLFHNYPPLRSFFSKNVAKLEKLAES